MDSFVINIFGFDATMLIVTVGWILAMMSVLPWAADALDVNCDLRDWLTSDDGTTGLSDAGD